MCPQCQSEAAYAPLSQEFVCLTTGCEWKKPVSEDEFFELFFNSKEVPVNA